LASPLRYHRLDAVDARRIDGAAGVVEPLSAGGTDGSESGGRGETMKLVPSWVLAIAAIGLSGAALAEDSPNLRTVGLDIFPLHGQNQPSSIGDFTGKVGYGLFSRDRTSGDWSHFESDMRYMQGVALDPRDGTPQRGQWALV
jgi:hypothetical protein